MRLVRLLIALTGGLAIAAATSGAAAQVNIDIGPAPLCPYGYYDSPPYDCSPYGYYGPAWFHRGEFIGAGPWFRGPRHFRGHVNRDFDRSHGYHGPLPAIGDRPDPANRLDHMEGFRGNEMRDGRGHAVGGRR